MKICLILLLMALSGCTQQQAKPEPTYRVEQRLSPAMKETVMMLIHRQSEAKLLKAKELSK